MSKDESFEQWCRERGPKLVRLARVLTGDASTAEDLVQDTLVKCLQNWKKVRRAEQPDAYAARIMINTHMTRSQRQRREREHWRHSIESGPRAESDPRLAAVDDQSFLAQRLQLLAPRQRTILVLRYYLEWSDIAIADALDCTTSTVRSQAARALATLRTAEQATTQGARP